jgi:hypothetical protein
VAIRRRRVQEGAPEALFDPSKVDLVALSPDGSAALLYIVNDSPWTGSDAQIKSLQAKIDNYVGFALDGEMTKLYPEMAGLDWRIVIDAQVGPPDPRSAQVIEHVAEAIRRYGGDLTIH